MAYETKLFVYTQASRLFLSLDADVLIAHCYVFLDTRHLDDLAIYHH